MERREPSWLWPTGLLRGYLVVGSLALAFAFLVYTQSVVNRVEDQGYAFVRMLRAVLESESADTSQASISSLTPLFNELRSTLRANLPVLVTDPADTVLLAVGIPAVVGRALRDQTEDVVDLVRGMDAQNQPIPLRTDHEGFLLGYIHWGEHRLIRELRWIPPLEVAIAGLFVLVGLLGLRRLKAAEQKSLWYGMARETAHQLGTPITSLLGWIELLRDYWSNREDASTSKAERAVMEMKRDIDRLAKVARRFERMGQPPNLEIMDVRPLLEDTANYFRARLPKESSEITILEEYGSLLPILANRDLITWVLENIVRNGLEALDGAGTIRLQASAELTARQVCIQISDTGRGMTGRVRSRAFRPGFSTKDRGWGLGLAMARRIVEEYHSGKLRIVRSQPGVGTLVEILLPAIVPRDAE